MMPELNSMHDAFVVVYLLFRKLTFSKKSFGKAIRVTSSLDPEQDRCPVGPNLGSNCLQRRSADNS